MVFALLVPLPFLVLKMCVLLPSLNNRLSRLMKIADLGICSSKFRLSTWFCIARSALSISEGLTVQVNELFVDSPLQTPEVLDPSSFSCSGHQCSEAIELVLSLSGSFILYLYARQHTPPPETSWRVRDSSRPKRDKHDNNRICPVPSFPSPLLKTDYIPKSSPQGLFPFLVTDSFLKQNTKAQ